MTATNMCSNFGSKWCSLPYTRDVRLIAVRKGCWSFILTKLLNSTNALVLDAIQDLMVGAIVCLANHSSLHVYWCSLSLTANRLWDSL